MNLPAWKFTPLLGLLVLLTLPFGELASNDAVQDDGIVQGELEVHVREFATVPARANGDPARLNMLTHANGKLYAVASLDGLIYEIADGQTTLWADLATALGGELDTSNSVHGGLRSIAFHPEFASNGLFYTSQLQIRLGAGAATYLSDADDPLDYDSVVSEWYVDAQGELSSPRELIRVGMPGPHPIRQIAFNTYATPDDSDYGNLYIAHGDGGYSTSPVSGQGNDALGKILRINPTPNGTAAYSIPTDNPFIDDSEMLDEVFALGFRNPHHLSFSSDGTLISADIGYKTVEEINIVEIGADYGWLEREGAFVLTDPQAGSDTSALPTDDALYGYTYPAAQFLHDPNYDGWIAIAGGYPIENNSALQGQYLFGELASKGEIYYSSINEMKSAITWGPPGDLTQATVYRANVLFDHDADPSTAPIAKTSMLDILQDSPMYTQGSTRADIRFGQGPSGEVYITSKQNNTIYLISNTLENAAQYELPPQDPVILEAEDQRWNSAQVATNHAGFSGLGYVNTANFTGNWYEFDFEAENTSRYKLEVRHAFANDTSPQRIEVTGPQQGNPTAIETITFPATDDWATWVTTSFELDLEAGNNTIRFVSTGDVGGPNLDRITITASSDYCDGFCLLENFDDKLNGSIRSQGAWQTNPGGALDGAVVTGTPPAFFTGKALQIDPAGVQFRGNAYLSLHDNSIAEGNTGTLFFQIYSDDVNDSYVHVGLSDLPNPRLTDGGSGQVALYKDFEAQFSLDRGQFSVKHGSDTIPLTNLNAESETLYNVWMVANNASDTYEVYLQGGSHVAPTKAFSGELDEFNFRNGPAAADLQTFYSLPSPNITLNSKHYFDNIYIDPDDPNISNPAPSNPDSLIFSEIATFESLEPGDLNERDEWSDSNATVVVDPLNNTNKALQISGGSNISKMLAGVSDQTQATLFFRMMRQGLVNASAGLSDSVAPSAYNDYEVQVNTQNDTALNVRDGGVFQAVNTFADSEWHCIWMMVDNSTDQYEVYSTNGSSAVPIRLESGSQTDFSFRNGSSDSLSTFFVKTSSSAGSFYIDDVYISQATENLEPPVDNICKPVAQPAIPTILNDPIPETIVSSGLGVVLQEFVTVPSSSSNTPLARINFLDHANDSSGRLFVNDLRGSLYVIDANSDLSEYLNIAAEFPEFVDSPGRGSGFGFFAFHPDFSTNGKFYTVHTEAGNALQQRTPDFPSDTTDSMHGIITEWTADSPASDSFSGTSRELLRIGFERSIHGIQQIGFNPTALPGSDEYGLLYVAIGDGHSTPNFTSVPQDMVFPHGKILRIDPLGTDSENGQYGIPSSNPYAQSTTALGEIWNHGFRNPHRFSWDSGGTNKMFIGHIGEKNIDGIYPGLAGANYGWNEREGSFLFKTTDPANVYTLPPDDSQYGFTYPVAQYDHDEGFAVVGGFVYRGANVPVLRGKYIFGDLVNGRIFYTDESKMITGDRPVTIHELTLKNNLGNTLTMRDFAGNDRADIRFGEDANGELYVLSKSNGKIWKIASDGVSNNAPVLSRITDQYSNVGNTVSLAAVAIDQDSDDLQFSASGLPDGITISQSGVISGQVENSGVFNVATTVTDDRGIVDTERFAWRIDAYNTYASYDTTAPTTTVLLTEDQTIQGTHTFTGVASDDGGSGLQSISISIMDLANTQYLDENGNYNAIQTTIPTTLLANGDWSANINFPISVNGDFQLRVIATDGDNNSNTSDTINFSIDNDAPVVTMNNVNRNHLEPGPVTISGTSVDNFAVAENKLLIKNNTTGQYWDGSNWVNDSTKFELAGTDNWSYTISLPKGNFSVVTHSWDTANNVGKGFNNISIGCEFYATGTTRPNTSGTPVVINDTTGTVISANFFNTGAINEPYFDGSEFVSVCIEPFDDNGNRTTTIMSDIGLDNDFSIKAYPEFIVGSKFGNQYETSYRYYNNDGLPAEHKWPVKSNNLDQNGNAYEFANLEYVSQVKGVGLPAFTNNLPDISITLDIDEQNVVGSERDVMVESFFYDTSANATIVGNNAVTNQPIAGTLNNIVGVGHRHHPQLKNVLLEMMVHVGALSPNDVSQANNNPGQNQLTENYSGKDFDGDGIDDHFDVDSHAYINSNNPSDPRPGIYSSGVDADGDGIDDADLLPVVIGNYAYSIWYGQKQAPIIIYSRETNATLQNDFDPATPDMDLTTEGEITLPWNDFLDYTLNNVESQLANIGVAWASGPDNPFPKMNASGGAIGGIEFGVEPQTNDHNDLPYNIIVSKFEVLVDGIPLGLEVQPIPTLLLGTTDTTHYGYNHGTDQNKDSVSFSFDGNNDDVNLSVTGLDVDFADEIKIIVNGVDIDSLSIGPNDQHTSPQFFVINKSLLQPSNNTLTFQQHTSGFKWGISDVLLNFD